MTMDAFDSAVNAAENRGIYYGQVQVTANFVVFPKGGSKQSYIENQHDPKDRRTEVSLVLSPIDEMGITNLITRSVIAESTEWAKIVWPSLRDDCKVANPREIDNKFVKIQMVPNGRSWDDKKTGEKREGTAMRFLAVYANAAACKQAFASDGNSARMSTVADSTDNAMAVDMTPQIDPNDAERETAKMFLPALVKSSGGNPAMLKTMLSGMPLIAKFYNIDSPEIKALMAA